MKKISIVGEVSTPVVQFMVAKHELKLGIMITASHNPATDSGVKILFRGGRKPTIEEEVQIESRLFTSRESGNKSTIISIYSVSEYLEYVKKVIDLSINKFSLPENEILIDGSGGWISSWLAKLLVSNGMVCREVGNRNNLINHNSGAGQLKEGKIDWKYCSVSDHLLLSQIKPCPKGSIIGFCFDGDGDRCFMLISTGDGVQVIGGDGFIRLFLSKIPQNVNFSAFITVESSLDIIQTYGNQGNGQIIETGVGDRWLQHSILNSYLPETINVGSEPSGHVVLQHIVRRAFFGAMA